MYVGNTIDIRIEIMFFTHVAKEYTSASRA